jgi:hypothetical protein
LAGVTRACRTILGTQQQCAYSIKHEGKKDFMTATRPTYRFSENAVSSTSNEFGNYILKRGAGEIRKPSWQRTETVVRFLPQWNFDGNEWEPYRRSPAPMDFGDWIRRYDAVRGFGENGVTFLLYDPIANPSYDLQTNPCIILHRAINQAIDNRQCEPDWPALLKGGPGRKAVLSKHSPIYLARAAIFRIKSKDMATGERAPLGLSNNDPGFFLEIPKSAGEKLIAMLEEKSEKAGIDVDDVDNYYKYGDIISLDKGAYVHIFEEGADPKNTYNATADNSPKQLAFSTGGKGNYGGGGGMQFKGYDMRIEKTWNGFSANLNTSDMERLIKGKQKPWEDCLQFFTHQEQAFLVQDGFPAKAILYAWRDHPEWIKDETRAKAVGRVSTAVEDKPAKPAVVVPPTETTPSVWKPTPVDNVVPQTGLGDTPLVDTNIAQTNVDRKEKARQALDEARRRQQGQ